MPFAAQMNLDDEEQRNEQGAKNISGQSTSFATNVPGQEGGSQKKQGSGRYTNIQSYLDANKQQAGQMGQKIATDVGAQAEQAKSQVQNFGTQAPKVEAYDPNEALKKDQMSAQEKEQYKTVKKTGGYTGPATVDQVSGYQDVQKAASSAAQNVQSAATEEGQKELLKKTYARPTYSQGQTKLDQALLQGSQESRSKLEDLSQRYSGIDKMFQDTAQNVGSAIGAAQKQALANQQAFAPAEKQAREALVNPLQERAKQEMASRAELQNRVAQDLQDEVLSQETMDLLGLTEGTRLFDTDLSKYLQADQSELGINDIATQQERQKYQALADLFENPAMNELTLDQAQRKPVSINDQLAKDLAAKQKWFDEYAQGASQTGTGSYKTGMRESVADASGTLADYMAGKAPTTNFRHLDSLDDIQGAVQDAESKYKALMEQLLADQKYNRVIKKG